MKKNRQNRSTVHIGTSGWSYEHWKENFYPEKLKSNDWLKFYSTNFSTVEINTTFYHLPRDTTVKNWYAIVPDNFLFAVKASGYITHQKRLHDCKNSLRVFFSSIKALKNKIGPILFQLPPSFKINLERLTEFISHLSKKHEYVFEFRHKSWFVKETYDLLSKHKIALCITDLNGKLSPEEITSHFTYIRLHGPQKAYLGSYGLRKIKSWKRKIESWIAAETSVYCYFDNDEKGYAIQDAKILQTLFER